MCTRWRATPAESRRRVDARRGWTRQPRVAPRDHADGIESHARLSLIELAASELLESETNGSMVLGVGGAAVEPMVVTAVGCSILVAVGQRSPVLMPIIALRPHGGGGPRAIAEGCDRALRTIHRLPEDFALTVSFEVAANATRFNARLA